MTDKPHFPAPERKSPYREPKSPVAEVAASGKRIVTRPDPPSLPDEHPVQARTKLTSEEVRALLTVTRPARKPWKQSAGRLGLSLVTTGLLGIFIRGTAGWVVLGVVTVLSIYWIARPLLEQRNEGW